MFKYSKVIYSIVCLIALSVSSPAIAADISIGAGGSWQSSPYKSHDDTVLPVPLIHFESERFYIRGLDAGVHIWRNEQQAVSFGVSYAALSFDPSKTDDRRLKHLDDRYSSLNAYLQYAVQTEYGHAGVRVLRDVLGNSDAFSAEAYYKYPLMLGPVYVSPGAGLRWDSEDQLDYYFGISSREARKSGLDKYSPDSGISPFLSLEADWKFAEHWSVMAAGRVVFLSKEIKDSPMVDDSQIFNATIGLKYSF
ncbi:MipA/OmpV family protein [Desulfovibrio sp. OttesenSCG-928-A18]|nr:MipA/OmpV family protein [Desulfovibrio sp. OttesenSCG-928-A18]